MISDEQIYRAKDFTANPPFALRLIYLLRVNVIPIRDCKLARYTLALKILALGLKKGIVEIAEHVNKDRLTVIAILYNYRNPQLTLASPKHVCDECTGREKCSKLTYIRI